MTPDQGRTQFVQLCEVLLDARALVTNFQAVHNLLYIATSFLVLFPGDCLNSIMSGNPIDRRMSINDVNLPSDLVKKQSIAALKELLQQDEATFFEYFEGLNLADVRELDT